MTINQLLQMPIGVESRSGGFQLTVKVARKTVEVDKKYLQWVIFMDSTGEIPGEVSLPKYIPLKKYQRIHITVCWLQQGENGKKLYVDQWYPITITEEELCTQRANFNDEFQYGEPLHIVKSKIRMHVVCAILSTGNFEDLDKDFINKWVDFIVTGK